MKKENGITLMLVVLAVVILLIITGIVYYYSVGKDGTVNQSAKIAFQQNMREILELTKETETTYQLENITNGKYFDDSEERTILKDYYGKLKILVSTKDNEAKLTVYYRPAEFTEEQRGWLEELGIKAYNRK